MTWEAVKLSLTVEAGNYGLHCFARRWPNEVPESWLCSLVLETDEGTCRHQWSSPSVGYATAMILLLVERFT
jgi:hypothetical protein